MNMAFLDVCAPISFEKTKFHTFLGQEFLSPCISRHNQLLLVTKGNVQFTENNKPRTVKKGEYYILRKNFFYAGFPSGKASTFFMIQFQGNWAQHEPGVKQQNGFKEELQQAAEKLWNAEKGNVSFLEKSKLFLQLMSLLPVSHAVPTPAQRIAVYLEQHLREPFSLETLCKTFRFSKNHIINLFKQDFNMTPLTYLQRARLKQAKKLIESDNASLAQVAALCGFPTYSHFYRSFHKTYHVSPEEWRLRKRK